MELQDTLKAVQVMNAYLNGEKIQYRVKPDNFWMIAYDPAWNWVTCEYRVAVDDRP